MGRLAERRRRRCGQAVADARCGHAVAARFGWRYKKGAVLDVLRAANWLMRSALAGRNGVRLALAPPLEEEEGEAKREEGEDVGQGFLPKGDEDTIWRARFGY